MKSSLCDDLVSFHFSPGCMIANAGNCVVFPQENQLVQVLEKNTELAIQNTDLQKQVQKLQHHEPGKSGNPNALTSTNMLESDRLDSILKVSRFVSI